jgi:hypothetical protein
MLMPRDERTLYYLCLPFLVMPIVLTYWILPGRSGSLKLTFHNSIEAGS